MSTETERINIAGNVRRLRRVRVLTDLPEHYFPVL